MVRSLPPSLPASPGPYGSPGPTPTRASGSRQSAGGTPTRARAAAGEMDLDAPNFNPKAFYADLVEKASLTDLLRVQADLSKEIRRLDQEKHDLIYGRHHDLVAASSTIQRMNASTSPLSDSLDNLRSAWSTISQLVESLSIPPPSHHSPSTSTSSTSKVDRLMKEMVDLPQMLDDLILLGRTDEALELWRSKRPILEKWERAGVQGSASVREECEELVRALADQGTP